MLTDFLGIAIAYVDTMVTALSNGNATGNSTMTGSSGSDTNAVPNLPVPISMVVFAVLVSYLVLITG